MTDKVFFVLGNGVRYTLFKYIASNGGWFSDDLITDLRITRKQFYAGMSLLRQTGLIRRDKRKWYITGYGKVVAKCIDLMDRADKANWAVQILERSRGQLNTKELDEAGRALISDQYVREIALAQ